MITIIIPLLQTNPLVAAQRRFSAIAFFADDAPSCTYDGEIPKRSWTYNSASHTVTFPIYDFRRPFIRNPRLLTFKSTKRCRKNQRTYPWIIFE